MSSSRDNHHDDVIKWKHFPRYWSFVRGIHRSPVNSPHKGQWRGALMFTLICVWINGCVNNGEAGDLRRYCAHYGVTVMLFPLFRSRSFHFDHPRSSGFASSPHSRTHRSHDLGPPTFPPAELVDLDQVSRYEDQKWLQRMTWFDSVEKVCCAHVSSIPEGPKHFLKRFQKHTINKKCPVLGCESKP